jgi:hypothetical protein
MIDVNDCHTHFALSENQGSLSYHYAAVTTGRPRGRRFRTAEPFCDGTLFFGGSRVAPGSSGRAVTTTRRLLSTTEKIFRWNAPHTLSQLESNIRKKLSPAEADNVVLAASPKAVKHSPVGIQTIEGKARPSSRASGLPRCFEMARLFPDRPSLRVRGNQRILIGNGAERQA